MKTQIIKDLFLSYSHEDKVFVHKLAEDCKEKGVTVWLDDLELLAGESLIQKIEKGIDQSKFFGIVVSSNSMQSDWVQEELRQAIIMAITEKRTKVIPIILSEVDFMPGFLRDKKGVDFSGWPKDEQQYKESLDFLIQSIFKYKMLHVERSSISESSDSSLGNKQFDHLVSNTLLKNLSLEYSGNWAYGKIFKGKLSGKICYIDGADRIWTYKHRRLQSLNKNWPSIKNIYNSIVHFFGDDDRGNLWCLMDRKLYVLYKNNWNLVSLPDSANVMRVILWKTPPNLIAGPIIPSKNKISMLFESDWKWHTITSPISDIQAIVGYGNNLLIASREFWAFAEYPELIWKRVSRFPARLSIPQSLFPGPNGKGFWVQCANHTLLWVDNSSQQTILLKLGINHGLCGNRIDKVVMLKNGEICCVCSGGVSYMIPGTINQFASLVERVPRFFWADSVGRVWGLINKEIWCWIQGEHDNGISN